MTVTHGGHPRRCCQGGVATLMWAAKNGRSDIVELFLTCGAKKNAQNNVRSTYNDESMG